MNRDQKNEVNSYLKQNLGISVKDIIAVKRLSLIKEMVNSPCPCCDSDDYFFISNKDRYDIPSQQVFCNFCGMFYFNPRPTEESLKKFYNLESERYRFTDCVDEYFKINYEGHQHEEHRLKIHQLINKKTTNNGRNQSEEHVPSHKGEIFQDYAEELFEEASRLVQEPVYVFEVGAANGNMLLPWKRHGDRVGGMEWDALKAKSALTHFGIELVSDWPSDFSENVKRPDVVLLLRTLEHMLHPHLELTKIKQNLKTNGLLVVDVPDTINNCRVGGFVAESRIDHLNMYTKNTLSRQLVRAGFTPLSVKSFSTLGHSSGIGERFYLRAIARNEEMIGSFVPIVAPAQDLAEMLSIEIEQAPRLRNAIRRKAKRHKKTSPRSHLWRHCSDFLNNKFRREP